MVDVFVQFLLQDLLLCNKLAKPQGKSEYALRNETRSGKTLDSLTRVYQETSSSSLPFSVSFASSSLSAKSSSSLWSAPDDV